MMVCNEGNTNRECCFLWGGMVGFVGMVDLDGWKRIKSRLRRKKTAADVKNSASCVSRVAIVQCSQYFALAPVDGRTLIVEYNRAGWALRGGRKILRPYI